MIDPLCLGHELTRTLERRFNVYGRRFRFEWFASGPIDGWEVRVVDEARLERWAAAGHPGSSSNRGITARSEITVQDVHAVWRRGDTGLVELLFGAAERAVTRLSPWAGKLRRIATRPLMTHVRSPSHRR